MRITRTGNVTLGLQFHTRKHVYSSARVRVQSSTFTSSRSKLFLGADSPIKSFTMYNYHLS